MATDFPEGFHARTSLDEIGRSAAFTMMFLDVLRSQLQQDFPSVTVEVRRLRFFFFKGFDLTHEGRFEATVTTLEGNADDTARVNGIFALRLPRGLEGTSAEATLDVASLVVEVRRCPWSGYTEREPG